MSTKPIRIQKRRGFYKTSQGLLAVNLEVFVLGGMSWLEAVKKSAPETLQYREKNQAQTILNNQINTPECGLLKNFTMLTFPGNWAYGWAVGIAKNQGWKLATPYDVLLTGFEIPKLNSELGVESIMLVSLLSQKVWKIDNVVKLWYYGQRRTVELSWTGSMLASEDFDPDHGREWFLVEGRVE